jgi:hypothetical protein
MYAGAFDERFKAVVPVCSVGNYQAYLGAACCLCEVVPGALQFTEEGAILGLVAPRALMVINATKDAPQFSVTAAQQSLAYAKPIFGLYQANESLRHTIIDSGHDYNPPMREAMYGWMLKHVAGTGDGEPVQEPPIQTEKPDDLRCFPGSTRPPDFVTLPAFAATAASQLHPNPRREAWERLLGLPAKRPPVKLEFTNADETQFAWEPEQGVRLVGQSHQPLAAGQTVAIVLHADGRRSASHAAWQPSLREAGWNLLTLDLRATGEFARKETIGRAPDHNTAEWSLWLGRPLLGQWTVDVRQLLDALAAAKRLPGRIVLIGEESLGLTAWSVAALDGRIHAVATRGTLATWVTTEPYQKQRLGTIVPDVLRDFGDVADLVALSHASRRLLVGPVAPNGQPLDGSELSGLFANRPREAVRVLATATPAEIVAALK